MAVCLIHEGPGVTQAQYEQVHHEVSPGEQVPEGCVYHVAGPTETGWCVVEVWESEEALQRFVQEKLHAALQRAGITGPPRVFPVANIMSR